MVEPAGNAATATQNTEDDRKTWETEKNVALLARSAASVRVDAPITVKDAGDVIRDVREMSKLGSSVTLKLADTLDLLPEEVRKAAEDTGGTQDNTYAVLHKDGSIYLILDAHGTREQLEKSIFHEFCERKGNEIEYQLLITIVARIRTGTLLYLHLMGVHCSIFQ